MKKTKKNIEPLFSLISRRYDLANRVMSLGLDYIWRKGLVKRAGAHRDEKILDVCAGTGDVIAAFLKNSPSQQIWGVDFSESMLSLARQKIARRFPRSSRQHVAVGDAHSIPFRDGEFEVVTVAFGMRNLENPKGGIDEMARVLRKGGRLVILEFAPPKSAFLKSWYRLYLSRLVPFIGGIISGEFGAYRYLSDSIAGFLEPDEVLGLLREARLEDVKKTPLTFGIAYLYMGRR